MGRVRRDVTRCAWAGSDPVYIGYHDREWGVPCYRDRRLFEFLILEGAQAGLSWSTILAKRAGYRRAFHGFDAVKVAAMTAADRKRLMSDDGIVRNRLKIDSAVSNARVFMEVRAEFKTFSRFVWSFVNHRPVQNRWRSLKQVPAETPESRAMSKALKQRGFRFVGPTICYAFMQAVGMVNDHVVSCFRHGEVALQSEKTGRKR